MEECFDSVRTFGCKAEYKVPDEKREKLDQKSRTALYLGTIDSCHADYFNTTRKAHRLYELEDFNIVYARDVVFNENEFPYQKPAIASLSVSYGDAMGSDEHEAWKDAMKVELKAHADNKRWDMVDQTSDMKLVEMKWVLTKKYKADGSFDRYKARLVARGFTRKLGVDYDECFCPTPRPGVIRVLIKFGLRNGWKVQQLDVKSAFLNGILDNLVYCKPAPGMGIRNGKALQLRKALYGLQEAGREWDKTYKHALMSIGFAETKHEPCVFMKDHAESMIYVVI